MLLGGWRKYSLIGSLAKGFSYWETHIKKLLLERPHIKNLLLGASHKDSLIGGLTEGFCYWEPHITNLLLGGSHKDSSSGRLL